MHRYALTLLSLIALVSIAADASADDAAPALPPDAIKFSKPKVAVYGELHVAQRGTHSGATTEIKSEKYRFLHVRLVMNYQLPEGSETLRVDDEDINLVQDGGKTFPAIGSYDSDKLFDDWARGFWLHTSNRRSNEMLDRVYAIPADAKGPFALVVSDLKTLRVELPKQASKSPHPADMVDVDVKRVAWGKTVPGESIRIGKEEIKTRFSVPDRRILAVSMLVHALDYNDNAGNQLSWNSEALSLRDSKGHVHACHGGFFNGYLSPNVSHSSEVGVKATDAETFFFSPPDDIESFEVLWFGKPVATHTIK
jgi:hypothetical protein